MVPGFAIALQRGGRMMVIMTTARFCGLYGHWYPHKKDNLSFYAILLSELKATVLAMKAIRAVNHDAKLIQTEDLAKVYSTPLLQYEADFKNHRRWISTTCSAAG